MSASDRPLEWFGLFEWPKLAISSATGELAHDAHELLAFTTVGILILHVVGALKHHFFDRDEVLARMLPLAKPRR